jgi:hypothetical protein
LEGIATVTFRVEDRVPSCVRDVMTVLPTALAVTRPVALTVATAGALLDHVTARFVAFTG